MLLISHYALNDAFNAAPVTEGIIISEDIETDGVQVLPFKSIENLKDLISQLQKRINLDIFRGIVLEAV